MTSAIQTQINNLAPKASPTFTGTVSVPGLPSTHNLGCGTNSVTCGTLTCNTGTFGGNTIATTNQIPSLTGYLKQATGLSPAYYNTGRCITLGCDSANNSYIDFHCLDTGTGNPDVRIQAYGATAGSNFIGDLSFYGSNF